MSSKPSNTRRVAPDVQRISELLKGTRPEMVFEALGFKSAIETAIEAAPDWAALCLIGNKHGLSEREKRLYSKKQEGFLVGFYQSINSMSELNKAKLVAEIGGSIFTASDWGTHKANRAIEIIKNSTLRPQTLADTKTELKAWWSSDLVREELWKLIDQYTLERIERDPSLSLDDLEELYDDAHSAEVKMVVAGEMLSHAINLWRALNILDITKNQQAYSLAEKFLIEELSKSDPANKERIASEIRNPELKYLAYKDLHRTYLEIGDFDSAEKIEEKANRLVGSGRHLYATRILAFDNINLSLVTSDRDVDSLILIMAYSPYGSTTHREANRLLLIKLDEIAREISTVEESSEFSQKYRHLFDETVKKTLSESRVPLIEEIILDAVTVEDYTTIWNKLDDTERCLMLGRFARLLAPLVPMPEPAYTIEVPEE